MSALAPPYNHTRSTLALLTFPLDGMFLRRAVTFATDHSISQSLVLRDSNGSISMKNERRIKTLRWERKHLPYNPGAGVENLILESQVVFRAFRD